MPPRRTDGTLRTYHARRDFRRTSEPRGSAHRTRSRPLFVIQKHDATSLHYDFRLEIDGALASWAVPKGPSTDPRERRLAIRTEDHPLEYADFEGTIPEGEYGGGAVLVWDTGPFRNTKRRDVDEDAEGAMVPLSEQLAGGHITVWLEGEKLTGGYALTQTRRRRGQEHWILVKMDDDEADARRNPVSTEPRSVLSDRTIEEIAAEATGDDADSGSSRGSGGSGRGGRGRRSAGRD